MGVLKSRARYAIHRYLNEELTEEKSKGQVSEVIYDFEKRLPERLLCQDVGLIVQEREQSILDKSDEFNSSASVVNGRDVSGHISCLPLKFECIDCGWRGPLVVYRKEKRVDLER
jgi:hypothetical protein